MADDLTASVSAWLAKTGYPLEMRVAGYLAEKLDNYPLQHNPNWEYLDVDSGETRECDYVFDCYEGDGRAAVILTLVVECKATVNPWVIFTRAPRRESLSAPIVDFDSSVATYRQQFLGQLTGLTRQISGELDRLSRSSRPGYAIAESHKKPNSRDVAYDAVRQVLSAARGVLDGTFGCLDDPYPGVAVAAPVIVTTSPIFEARLSSDNRSVEVDRVGAGRILIKSGPGGRALVSIVEEAHIGEVVVKGVSDFTEATKLALGDGFHVETSDDPAPYSVVNTWRARGASPRM